MRRCAAPSNGFVRMDMPAKAVVIAALKREVQPLLDRGMWRRSDVVRSAYGSFESGGAVVICAGIGAEPAARAAEAAVRHFAPSVLVSAGLAGGLTPDCHVAQVIVPATILRASTGGTVEYLPAAERAGLHREGVLVSASSVAGAEGKRMVATRYGALAVDMEAAAVAEVATAHRIPFLAIKAISDEYDFPMPDMRGFVDGEGRFRNGRFVLHAVLRPRIWSIMSNLASNSSRASLELCRVLGSWLQAGDPAPTCEPALPAGSRRPAREQAER